MAYPKYLKKWRKQEVFLLRKGKTYIRRVQDRHIPANFIFVLSVEIPGSYRGLGITMN